MNVEVITIGDELLLGQVIDTNAAFLSEQLAAAGFRVTRRSTVGDEADAIADAVSEALQRTRVVITTGGLGPTRDDVTKAVVAKLYGRALEVNEDLLDRLRQRWQQRGVDMPASNTTQAEVPHGATILPNALGTAPGLVLEGERGVTIMLPGVPSELRTLTLTGVIPYLLETTSAQSSRSAQRPQRRPVCYRQVRTTGVAESALAERIDDIVDAIAPLAVAFLPGTAGVDLRITSWGAFDRAECDRRFDEAERLLRERLGTRVYATGTDGMELVVGRMLRERKLQLAVAESCTGGLLGQRISSIAGSSEYFVGGLITYSNDAKVDLLGVRLETLAANGAVSEETAREMVAGAIARTGATAAISITGVAGPGGGTPDKPVGLVWTAVCVNDLVRTHHSIFPGDRAEIRERSSQMGLALLYEMLAAS